MVIFILCDVPGWLLLQRFILVLVLFLCFFMHRHRGFWHCGKKTEKACCPIETSPLTWLCHPTNFTVETIMIRRSSKSFCWKYFLVIRITLLLLVR